MSGAIPLRLKGIAAWHLLLAVLLAALFLYLALRAHDEYRWSDWEFGDAQTMLSLRHWQEGGWGHNYLLFRPQGYAVVTDLLDDPELRHHAHGISPGSSPQVGPRLLYTHYPAGYLIPYATLFALGVDSMFAMRLLSIVFSLAALAVMYALFAALTEARVAFVAVLFYAVSVSFLGYADSLANQPVDDLLRFGFMFAIVGASRAASAKWRQGWTVAAWGMEFLLSLSSFDSVFYLYLWLIAWDLLEGRGWRWRTYFIFALAPLVAHALQFSQNVWYLGWEDAVRDIQGTFSMKSGSPSNGGGRLAGTALALISVIYMVYSPGFMIVIVLGMYLVGRQWFRPFGTQGLPGGSLLLALFLCGLGFVVVFPMATRMASYEGRQMIPFVALLASAYTWLVLDGCRTAMAAGGGGDRQLTGAEKLRGGYLVVAMAVLLLFWAGAIFSNRFQPSGQEYRQDFFLARGLQDLTTQHEPVYFTVGGFEKFFDPDYVPGYPQIQPETEYYAASRPILCFDTPDLLAQDIATLLSKLRPGQRFSPVVVTDSPATMAQVLSALNRRQMLAGLPGGGEVVLLGKVALDLTPFLRWR